MLSMGSPGVGMSDKAHTHCLSKDGGKCCFKHLCGDRPRRPFPVTSVSSHPQGGS